MLEVAIAIALIGMIISGTIFVVRYTDAVEHLKRQNPVVVMFWPFIVYSKNSFTDQGQGIRESSAKWLAISIACMCVVFSTLIVL